MKRFFTLTAAILLLVGILAGCAQDTPAPDGESQLEENGVLPADIEELPAEALRQILAAATEKDPTVKNRMTVSQTFYGDTLSETTRIIFKDEDFLLSTTSGIVTRQMVVTGEEGYYQYPITTEESVKFFRYRFAVTSDHKAALRARFVKAEVDTELDQALLNATLTGGTDGEGRTYVVCSDLGGETMAHVLGYTGTVDWTGAGLVYRFIINPDSTIADVKYTLKLTSLQTQGDPLTITVVTTYTYTDLVVAPPSEMELAYYTEAPYEALFGALPADPPTP